MRRATGRTTSTPGRTTPAGRATAATGPSPPATRATRVTTPRPPFPASSSSRTTRPHGHALEGQPGQHRALARHWRSRQSGRPTAARYRPDRRDDASLSARETTTPLAAPAIGDGTLPVTYRTVG